MGLGQVALILGVVALALGGAGLAIALTHAGPAGPTGPTGNTGTTGLQGPPGPGATVEQNFNAGTTTIAGVCTYYEGSNLSFNVTTPGTFVLSASVTLYLYHTSGYSPYEKISLTNASGSSCSQTGDLYAVPSLASGEPTGYYLPTVSVVQSFVVGSAGTYTFGLAGIAAGGGSGDFCDFYYAGVVGVFYPS